MSDCKRGCYFYVDDGGELFGEVPHCVHDPHPPNINLVADGEESCKFFVNFREFVKYKQCDDERHRVMKNYDYWSSCPDCGKKL